jgi:trehalose 6-phosphate synthase
MNLVSKEFVASRVSGDGTLIISRFTGAARELEQAILINPYNTEEMCEAIRSALEMPLEEQKNAMLKMRATVEENDIYSWASQIINDLTRFIPVVEPQ